jgi:hypothetical protein
MQQTLAAIAGGAVAGATFAAAGPAGLAETMGAGVISNVAGSSLTRGLSGESVDGHTALMDAGVGAAGGALGFGVNKAVSGIVSVFNTKSAIKQIGDYAADHAYGPHIQNPSDDIERVFATNFSSKGELSSYVQKIIKTTPNNNIRQLGDGRTAFWDDAKKAVIIYNAPKPHRSSVYSPSRGRAYFEDLD